MSQEKKKYKYRLTDEVKIIHDGRTLYRIQKWGKYDYGGWVEGYENLSHEGDCWVGGEAQVYGKARVTGNAEVANKACVCDRAQISGHAYIGGCAIVKGDAEIFDFGWVSGNAIITGHAQVFDNSHVFGLAIIGEQAKIYGQATIYGTSFVHGSAKVYGIAHVYGCTKLLDNVEIYDAAKVAGKDLILKGNFKVFENGRLLRDGITLDYGKLITDLDSADPSIIPKLTNFLPKNDEILEKSHCHPLNSKFKDAVKDIIQKYSK